MSTTTRSSRRSKLVRVHWQNRQVAYCLFCQRSYPPQTERYPECGGPLLSKMERVELEDR